MSPSRGWREILFIGLICVLWYGASSTSGVISKMLLQSYPYPITAALTNLLSIVIFSAPLLNVWQLPVRQLTLAYKLKYLAPLSLGKAVAISTSYLALNSVAVSYANTVKALMPFFSVICAKVIFGESQTIPVYLSLLPIAAGVGVASATELSFNVMGFLSGICSTFAFSLMNIFVKRVLADTHMHPLKLLSWNAQLAALFLLPLWCIKDGYNIWTDITARDKSIDLTFIAMMMTAGFMIFVQNLCAFTLIHKLSSLSYAVANATKRITVIVVSLITLHNPVTGANLCGMLIAVAGVFIYSQAKARQKEQHMVRTMTHMTLSDASLFAMQPPEAESQPLVASDDLSLTGKHFFIAD